MSSTSTSSTPPSIKEKIQSTVATLLQHSGPVLLQLGNIINIIGPKVAQFYAMLLTFWVSLQPYHPNELLPALFGLFMVFFGGHYLTTFAAIEAYRLCGWTQTRDCLILLYENFLIVKEANEKDNQIDDNNDGIADVKQISSKELMTRKLHLILKSMDPKVVSDALSGIWMGFMAVVAVLRVQFAQTIALGVTISSIFEAVAEKFLRPILEQALPKEYHKWVSVLISYFCKCIGVSIAWTIQRVISSFYSSIRGAQMLILSLIAYLSLLGHTYSIEQGSILFTGLVGLVAFLGFFWQVSSAFSLPLPLSILLFPLTLVEWFLTWMVAVEA